MDGIGDLHLSSATWIDRRVDRFEFVGLTTIEHSIALTLDLGRLPKAELELPIGMFDRDRPPSRVIDATGKLVRHLPSERASDLVRADIEQRLARVGVTFEVRRSLAEIARHRSHSCALVATAGGEHDGYADLAREKWGCPYVGILLRQLQRAEVNQRATSDIARLLFDWQNCHPLVVRVDPGNAAFSILTISFDEELTPWFPPWDRRWEALGSTYDRLGDGPLGERDLAARVSRGGPFGEDLQELEPRRVRGWMSRSRTRVMRKLGRSHPLHMTWHVVWEQWAVGDFERQIEVTVPPELSVVRLRSLRPGENPGEPAPDMADQVGPRARLTLTPDDRRAAPELMSLLLCHRDQQSWIAGAVVAALAGGLLVLGVWLALAALKRDVEAAVTVILLGPAIIAGFLSARATSEIADKLLVGLRRLHASVALGSALSAASLVASDGRFTQVTLSVIGALLLVAGGAMAVGAWRSGRLLRESLQRELPTKFRPGQGRLAACEHGHRTPLPDRFIVSGEGERVPWGWLRSAGAPAPPGHVSREEDRRYWRGVLGPHPDRAAAEALVDFARRAVAEHRS